MFVVVQVMEFRDCDKTGFQHFGEGEGGDGFDVVRRHAVSKMVH
jgi:hypothetical protein